MDKQEAIEKAKKLVCLIEDLPDDVLILSCSVVDNLCSSREISVQLNGGIEKVAAKRDMMIDEETSRDEFGEYTRKHVKTVDCYYTQVEEKDG